MSEYPFTWTDVGERGGGNPDDPPYTQQEKEEIAARWNTNHEEKESTNWLRYRINGKTTSHRDRDNNRIIDSKEEGYIPITDQLDMLYWDKKNGTNNWEKSIDEVKKRFPKQL
jgi:hypothetical protein|tara:strand:+ start:367 stop:705 length:339 start_codon:yes stop_codon:yes gene_type:complete